MEAPEIKAFASKMLANIEVDKAPKHYGARAVQIVPNKPNKLQDARGRIWAVVRDGQHYLREDGSWQ